MTSKRYFENFPTIDYKTSKFETKKALDILRRVGISESVLNDDRNLIGGFVKDGATPEDVAETNYGDRSYYWLVLLSAKIHNPYYGWPLEYQQLRQRMQKEYPGISLFVSASDTVMDTKSEAVNFSIGDKVEIVNTALEGQGGVVYSGTIYDYDLTSGHMKIKDIVDPDQNTLQSYATSTTGNNFQVKSTTDSTKLGYLRRKIIDVNFSLYRFEDAETKREYSPLHRYGPGETTLIETYTNTGITQTTASGELQSSPILSAGIDVITVEQREEELNDRNRYIKIIKPSLAQRMINEIKSALRN